MEIISEGYRKARKNHKCDWCGSNIFKGEIYRDSDISRDDEIYNWKSCDHCKNMVSKMWEEWGYMNNGEGLNDTHFDDYISENDIDFKRR